jgi:hypothetical protein
LAEELKTPASGTIWKGRTHSEDQCIIIWATGPRSDLTFGEFPDGIVAFCRPGVETKQVPLNKFKFSTTIFSLSLFHKHYVPIDAKDTDEPKDAESIDPVDARIKAYKEANGL